MPKKNATLAHIVDRRPTNTLSIPGPQDPPPPHRRSAYRLSYGGNQSEKRSTSYTALARSIKLSSLPSTVFFLDTCFANAHDVPGEVWEALEHQQTVLTPGILFELREWLDHPYRNKRFNNSVRAAASGAKSSVRLLDMTEYSTTSQAAAKYYVQLLGVRKLVAIIEQQQFQSEFGRPPTDAELAARCKRIVGERGWRLAQKGMAESKNINFGADEELVVWAVVSAVLSGRETVILTRDTDVMEQFYKMVYLLDTHYRSCLIAHAVSLFPSKFTDVVFEKRLPPLEMMQPNQAVVKSMPYRFDDRVLPHDHTPVSVQCWLFGGDPLRLSLASLSFLAEREMKCVINAKGCTNGMNTYRLNGKNCHRCFLPVDGIPADWFVVGHDQRVNFLGLDLPMVDVELSIRTREKTERLQYYKGPLQIPPAASLDLVEHLSRM